MVSVAMRWAAVVMNRAGSVTSSTRPMFATLEVCAETMSPTSFSSTEISPTRFWVPFLPSARTPHSSRRATGCRGDTSTRTTTRTTSSSYGTRSVGDPPRGVTCITCTTATPTASASGTCRAPTTGRLRAGRLPRSGGSRWRWRTPSSATRRSSGRPR